MNKLPVCSKGTYSNELAVGSWTRRSSSKRGPVSALVPSTGGGASSYACLPWAHGQFSSPLKASPPSPPIYTSFSSWRAGRRHQVKLIWAYMLLGQLVAISVASNLFYLALLLAAPPRPAARPSAQWAPPALWIPVLLSLATVALSPLTDDRRFLPNLLLMHALIVVPLLVPDSLFHQSHPKPASPLAMGLSTLYTLVFVVALALQTRAISTALGNPAPSATEFARRAWEVLHSHPAQASIGWDVIWTTVSFVAWLLLRPEQGKGPRFLTAVYLLLAAPLVSVGVLAPHVLRPREDVDESEKRKQM
jgi:hypothetical protein